MMALTRYFTFTRVNPAKSDYDLLLKVSREFDAFIGYMTLDFEMKSLLKGFMILRGVKTCSSGRKLISSFPNFLLSSVSSSFIFDFENLPEGVVYHNKHPYEELKRVLNFDNEIDGSLSEFLTQTDDNGWVVLN